MNTNNSFIRSVLSYSKSQRIGIILFFLIIVLAQGIYYFYNFSDDKLYNNEKDTWLANQSTVDSIKLDSKNYKPKLYPSALPP
jgi:hypothetical protein